MPPPDYPYLKVIAAHSAAVQLYARSGQLATADILKEWKKIDDDKCRLGCNATESPWHLFIECQHYDRWRKEAKIEVIEKTKLKAETIGIDEQTKCSLMTTAKSLFHDDPTIWPLHSSFYYLGQILALSKLVQNASNLTEIQKRRIVANVTADWHLISIWLVGRIFGDFQRRMAALNQCPTHT